jgi:HSP20 family molecular chaperone IbpA
MSTLTRRDRLGPFMDVFDWLEPPWTMLRPAVSHPMRVEDYVKDGTYVLRAELPGVDPEKDIEVTVSKGVLTISAQRQEETEDKHRSEFHYGAFARSVTLPEGADEDHIRASYDSGILEVVVTLKDQAAAKAPKRVPVAMKKHLKPT